MTQDLADDKSTLVHVMAWCLTAPSHYLNQCLSRSITSYGITRLQWVNRLCRKQRETSKLHFTGPLGGESTVDILQCIFVNEDIWISINISLKFVSNGQINNNPALVQIMAWRRPGDKPLSEPMMVRLLSHMCVTRPQCVKDLSDLNSFRVASLALGGTVWRAWVTIK